MKSTWNEDHSGGRSESRESAFRNALKSSKNTYYGDLMKEKIFTLIELLIVVAIVMILASMLLPALNRARESGYKTLCVSNMRQMAAGLTIYTTSHDDYFPACIQKINDINYGWNYLLGYDSFKNIYCPRKEFLPPGSDGFADFYTGLPDFNRVWYGYNYYLGPTGPTYKSVQLDRPSTIVAFAEIASINAFPYTTGLDGNGLSTTQSERKNWMAGRSRHTGGSNYLFADGHITYYKAPVPWYAPMRSLNSIHGNGERLAEGRFYNITK